MRKSIKKKLERIGMSLSKADSMESAQNGGAKWKIHHSGYAGGQFFDNLKDASDYVDVELDCQNS